MLLNVMLEDRVVRPEMGLAKRRGVSGQGRRYVLRLGQGTTLASPPELRGYRCFLAGRVGCIETVVSNQFKVRQLQAIVPKRLS